MPRAKKSPPIGSIVVVSWVDASFDADGSGNKPVASRTVGYLIESTPDYIKVAHEVFQDGEARGTTAIPGGMIHELQVVVRSAIPVGWPIPTPDAA